MPYIPENEREELSFGAYFPKVPGHLNWWISKLVHNYIENKGLSYNTINEVIGVLECAKMELYRTVAGPYEDKKRLENGSVSNLDSKNLEDVR